MQGLNTDLAERISVLGRILEHTLNMDDTISFATFRIMEEFRPFWSPGELHTHVREPDRRTYVGQAVRPSGLQTTQRYVEGDSGAKGKLVRLV